MKEYLVLWSPKAEETYLAILQFIIKEWSIKEAEAFDNRVDDLILQLKRHKNLCPPSRQYRRLRKCVITSQTSLIYQFRNSTIEIIAFIDNRSDHSF